AELLLLRGDGVTRDKDDQGDKRNRKYAFHGHPPLPRCRRAGGPRWRLLRMQDDLLRAPCGDLGYPQLVFVAAVHAVNRAELLQLLPGLAEFADDGPVELHLVDLAGDVTRRRRVAVRIRVRGVEVLMRPWRDAERPRVADVVVDRAQDQVVVEHLD